jgi:hypothetical protein
MRVIRAAIVMLALVSAAQAQTPTILAQLIAGGFEIKASPERQVIYLQKQTSAYVCFPILEANLRLSSNAVQNAPCFRISG